MTPTRAGQLAANLNALEQRLVRACDAGGRPRQDVTLVAVSKTFPASDVRVLADLGVTDFGESRDQEAQPKAAAVADVRWHFVGRLQSNKVRSVAAYADVVQTVDRLSLPPLLAGAATGRPPLDVLIQVSLDGDPARGGAVPDAVVGVADAVAAEPALRLRGLMAVAPLGEPPEPHFARLAEVAQELQSRYPEAMWCSAGMSADLEAAIAAGATHVRVGSALFGGRSPDLR